MKQIGRPEKYKPDFYKSIVKQNEEVSYNQLAKIYKVDRSTIARWIRRGKELAGNG